MREILLQCAVRLLGGVEVTRLQFLAQLLQQLADPAGRTPAATVVMMAALCHNLILEVLLNLRIVLLRRRNTPGLKVLRKLLEVLGDGIGALQKRRNTA